MKKLCASHAGALAVAVLLAALLFAGCDNPINNPETGGDASPLGTVRLVLAVQKPRTLVPDTDKTLVYKIAAQSGADTQTIDETWDGAAIKTFGLAEGTWTITVIGFFTEGGNTVNVSQGNAEVTVTANQTAPTVTINLTPLGVLEGAGSLKYGGLSFTGLNLTSGTVTLKSATDSSTAPIERNLLDAGYGADSVITAIPAGYYWLTVKLGNANGYAVKSDLVHIYKDRTANITGSAVFTFSAADFSKLLTAAFTLSADGNVTTGTTKLFLSFTPAITDLTAADIVISPAGAVTIGALTPGSTAAVYELAVSNVTVEEITVAINRTDYEIASQSVEVIPTRYTLIFDTQGGSAIAPATVTAGSQVDRPANPSKSGYAFNNWYTAASGGDLVTWPITVNGNTTVYARWDLSGQGSITINLSGLPQDETTNLSGAAETLSWLNGTLNVSVPTTSFTGASYQWYLDNAALSGATVSSLSKPGSDFTLGRHEITVRIITTDNKVYSKTLRFTVVQ